jgi:hypothetical protein
MPPASQSADRPNVPLTRFHNNTGEFLDLALTSPITLTKHGRAQWKITEAGYYDRLEALANGNILAALNREHLFSADLTGDMAARIAAQMPSAEEIATDRWQDA